MKKELLNAIQNIFTINNGSIITEHSTLNAYSIKKIINYEFGWGFNSDTLKIYLNDEELVFKRDKTKSEYNYDGEIICEVYEPISENVKGYRLTIFND